MFEQFTHFHQTLDYLIASDHYDTAARLTESISRLWEIHDYLPEGLHYLALILNAPNAHTLPSDLRAKLLLASGNFTRHQCRYVEAAKHYDTALALDAQNHDTTVKILSGMGEIALRRGDYQTAQERYQQHFDISRSASDAARTADAVNGLGRIATIRENLNEALDLHRFGQRISVEAGYLHGLGWSFNALGELERARGSYRKAVNHFEKSLSLFTTVGDPGAAAMVRQNMAFAWLATGDASSAYALFDEVIRFWMRGYSAHGAALCLIGIGSILLDEQPLEAARLLIFARRTLGEIGIQLELGDRIDYERAMTRLVEKVTPEVQQSIEARVKGATLQGIWSCREAPPLTAREIDLLRLLKLGMTDKEIAARLLISPHTVNTHLRAIYRKLGVNTRTAAVHAAEYLI